MRLLLNRQSMEALGTGDGGPKTGNSLLMWRFPWLASEPYMESCFPCFGVF